MKAAMSDPVRCFFIVSPSISFYHSNYKLTCGGDKMKKRAALIVFLLLCGLFFLHGAAQSEKSTAADISASLKPVTGLASAFGSSEKVSTLVSNSSPDANAKTKTRFNIREIQSPSSIFEYPKD